MIDRRGFFGRFFGMAAAPTLIPEVQEVKADAPEPKYGGIIRSGGVSLYSGIISSGYVYIRDWFGEGKE